MPIANADHTLRSFSFLTTKPRLTGAVGAVVLVIATVVTLLGGGLIEASRWVVRDSAVHWITGLPDGLPYRPPEQVMPQDLRSWSLDAPDHVQISHDLAPIDGAPKPLTLSLPVVLGDATLFVNGVPVEETASSSSQYLAVSGGRAAMWGIPADLLRPGPNRLDIMVAGAGHRALGAPLVLSSYDGSAILFKVMAVWNAHFREWLLGLSMLAVALTVGASVSLRAPTPWVAVSAAAAAIGGRAAVSEIVLPGSLVSFGPLLDQVALCAALICLGCAFIDARAEIPRQARRWIGAGLLLLFLLIGLAGIGAWRDMASLETVGLIVPSIGLAFLVWAGGQALRPTSTRTIPIRAMEGVVWGLLALTASVAVIGASGLAWGLWVSGLEVAYGLGVFALLGGLAIIAGWMTARSVWRWARDRPRLSQIILSQQQEIEATALALQQQLKRSAILEERQRLSRDMHDGIGGQLISLLARVRSRRITPDQLEGELTSGLSELRLMVDSLDASDGPIADALAVLRSRIRTQTEAAHMSLDWSQSEALNAMTAETNWVLNLNRLIQEAVTNAIRHADADHVEVAIELTEDHTLAVMIRDNGIGFDRDKVQPGRGLANLTFRAAQMGGLIEIGRDDIGVGTVIRSKIIIPHTPSEPLTLGHQSSDDMIPN